MSVAANALGHGLAAFGIAPPWWVVVAVSAVAPAVLGSVVHLAVLVGRPDNARPGPMRLHDDTPGLHAAIDADRDVGQFDDRGQSRFWEHADPATPSGDRVATLIAEGVGRRRLARELGISEYEARQLLDRTRTADTPSDGPTAHDPSADEASATGMGMERDAAANWESAVNGSGRRPS